NTARKYSGFQNRTNKIDLERADSHGLVHFELAPLDSEFSMFRKGARMKKSTITIAACSFTFLSIAVALAFGALLLDSPVPDLSNEFKTGFLASLWEDVVFFSTIGLAAILFQMIFRPQESFFNRMKSIFGNRIKYT